MVGGTLRLVEWFSGIGGCRAACPGGIDVVLAVDVDERARRVYESWWGDAPKPWNIATLKAERVPEADVWWMSPPCQPYTFRGRQKDLDDRRSQAFLQLLELLWVRTPRALVLENVPWFEGSQAHRRLRVRLKGLGFHITERLLCPTDLGIPMTRRRFFLAARRDAEPDVVVEAARRPLSSFVDVDAVGDVEPDVLERFGGALHVVDPADPDAVAACFTSAYTRSPVYAGSYLRRPDGGVRTASPAEILRLMGFPPSLAFPADMEPAHRYKLVGNAVSVDCARVMLRSVGVG